MQTGSKKEHWISTLFLSFILILLFSSHLIHLCISLSALLYLPRSFVSSSRSDLYNCFLNPTRSQNILLFLSPYFSLTSSFYALPPPPPRFFFLLPAFHRLYPSPPSVSRSLSLVYRYEPMPDCQRGRAVQTPGGWRSWQPLRADTH